MEERTFAVKIEKQIKLKNQIDIILFLLNSLYASFIFLDSAISDIISADFGYFII